MPIRATMMLADSAQAVAGKLYILGGGWNIIGPEPSPTAIAIYIEVSWDLTNLRHHWRLELVDNDGEAVEVPGPMGAQAVVLEGDVEVGRPPGIRPGTGLGVPIAINLGPLPLEPDSVYAWRLMIGDQTDDNWRLPFSTRPAPPASQEPAGEGEPG
jgi:hypothetical protein